jgi:DNA (cytosine-5)-methyltransferase 1
MTETISQKKIKLIDLFCGTGAFSYTFSKISSTFECVFANDFEKKCETIYNLNHLDVPFILGDINDIDVSNIPKHDILCGGFPCQPFSIAGKKEGFNDKRSNVFWKILEIIQYHQPEIVILENVKNLKSHDNGNTFEVIEENLEKCGYYVKYDILDTCKITDVPQHRERIYILCFKNKELYEKFNFDFSVVKNKLIKDFLLDEHYIPDKYYYKEKLKVYDTIKNSITKSIDENVIYQYRRHFVRENKSNVCPTLTANMGIGGHNVPIIMNNNKIRKLTPRECFNLQGFDEDYKLPKLSDATLYKIAGNAVSIPIIKLIAEKIYNILND